MKITYAGHNVAQIRLLDHSIELAPYALPVHWANMEDEGFSYVALYPRIMHGSLTRAKRGSEFFDSMLNGTPVKIPNEYAVYAGFDRGQQVTLVKRNDHIELWRTKRYQYVLEQLVGMQAEQPLSGIASISQGWLSLPPSFYTKWGDDKLVVIPYRSNQNSLLILPFEIFMSLPKTTHDDTFLRLYYSAGRETKPHFGKVKLTNKEQIQLESISNIVSVLYNSNRVEVSKAFLGSQIERLVIQSA